MAQRGGGCARLPTDASCRGDRCPRRARTSPTSRPRTSWSSRSARGRFCSPALRAPPGALSFPVRVGMPACVTGVSGRFNFSLSLSLSLSLALSLSRSRSLAISLSLLAAGVSERINPCGSTRCPSRARTAIRSTGASRKRGPAAKTANKARAKTSALPGRALTARGAPAGLGAVHPRPYDGRRLPIVR